MLAQILPADRKCFIDRRPLTPEIAIRSLQSDHNILFTAFQKFLYRHPVVLHQNIPGSDYL
jgi:hypothetical protein